jgi:hypothetical protein
VAYVGKRTNYAKEMRMLNPLIRAKDGTEYRLAFSELTSDDEVWRLVEGVRLPQRFEVHEPLTPNRRFPDGAFRKDPAGGRSSLAVKGVSYVFVLDDTGFPRCQTLLIGLWGMDSDVVASDLRRVRIDHARATAVEFFEGLNSDHPDVFADPLAPGHVDAGAAQRIARRRTIVTPEVLQAVADVYIRALPTGRPTRVVAEHFGVAVRTASLRVKQAHEAGLITQMARETGRDKR